MHCQYCQEPKLHDFKKGDAAPYSPLRLMREVYGFAVQNLESSSLEEVVLSTWTMTDGFLAQLDPLPPLGAGDRPFSVRLAIEPAVEDRGKV